LSSPIKPANPFIESAEKAQHSFGVCKIFLGVADIPDLENTGGYHVQQGILHAPLGIAELAEMRVGFEAPCSTMKVKTSARMLIPNNALALNIKLAALHPMPASRRLTKIRALPQACGATHRI